MIAAKKRKTDKSRSDDPAFVISVGPPTEKSHRRYQRRMRRGEDYSLVQCFRVVVKDHGGINHGYMDSDKEGYMQAMMC